MIILMIVLLIALGDCDCGSSPPPTVVSPPPTTCMSVVLCVSSCTGTGTTSCAPCPAGTFDVSLCGDSGFPSDAGSCDDVPCAAPSQCAYACDEEPFYVGCCECPEGTIDQNTWCEGIDAGPPDDAGWDGATDAGPGDGGDAGDAGFDAGGLLRVGEACFDDRQCASGLCYGEADASGAFLPPTCQAMCLPLDDRGFWCRSDRHCCEGTCCVGCGELEGLCRTTP